MSYDSNLIAQLIKDRRTVHNYTNEPVPDETIKNSLSLAAFALNHKHTRPWFFRIVGPKARSKIAELVVATNYPPESNKTEEFLESVKKKFTTSSHLIIIGQKRVDDPLQAQEDYAAIACAIQIVTLHLWSQGIGAKWSSSPSIRTDEIYDIVDIDAKKVEIVGYLKVGKFSGGLPRIPEKAKLESFLSEVP